MVLCQWEEKKGNYNKTKEKNNRYYDVNNTMLEK